MYAVSDSSLNSEAKLLLARAGKDFNFILCGFVYFKCLSSFLSFYALFLKGFLKITNPTLNLRLVHDPEKCTESDGGVTKKPAFVQVNGLVINL